MADNKINNDGVPTGWRDRAEWVPPGCGPAGLGAVSAWVAGVPAPQGSKRGYARRGRGGKLHVSLVESSERVKPWREDVRQAFLDVLEGLTSATGGGEGMAATAFPVAALVVKIVFVMPRPKAAPKTRATPPAVKKPDLDKLVRAVLDALTSAGVYADDSQVVTLHAHKRLAELGEPTGAMIHVEPVPEPCGPHCHFVHAQDMPTHEGPCVSCADPARCVANLTTISPPVTYPDDALTESGLRAVKLASTKRITACCEAGAATYPELCSWHQSPGMPGVSLPPAPGTDVQ